MTRLCALTLIVLLAACGADDGDCRDCNWKPRPGELVLSMGGEEGTVVSFEFVAPDLLEAELLLKNVGEQDLRVTSVEVEGGIHAAPGEVGFAVPLVVGAVIPPGGSQSVAVTFTPAQRGVVFGRIQFVTDGGQSIPTLTLTGRIERSDPSSCLKSSVARIRSEGEATCESGEQQVSVRNDCDEPVSVISIALFESPLIGDDDSLCPTCTDYSLAELPTLPWELPAKGSLDLAFRYAPRAEGEDRAQLLVTSEEAQLEVTLQGTATELAGACGPG